MQEPRGRTAVNQGRPLGHNSGMGRELARKQPEHGPARHRCETRGLRNSQARVRQNARYMERSGGTQGCCRVDAGEDRGKSRGYGGETNGNRIKHGGPGIVRRNCRCEVTWRRRRPVRRSLRSLEALLRYSRSVQAPGSLSRTDPLPTDRKPSGLST